MILSGMSFMRICECILKIHEIVLIHACDVCIYPTLLPWAGHNTKSIFLKRGVQLVWIKSFLFTILVVLQMLKNLVYYSPIVWHIGLRLFTVSVNILREYEVKCVIQVNCVQTVHFIWKRKKVSFWRRVLQGT